MDSDGSVGLVLKRIKKVVSGSGGLAWLNAPKEPFMDRGPDSHRNTPPMPSTKQRICPSFNHKTLRDQALLAKV